MMVVDALSEACQAIVSGSAINQDGRSSNLTSPHGPSQRAVIIQAWQRAGVDIANLALLSGHLTGTALGDPIEIGALSSLLQMDENNVRPDLCRLQAFKSIAGHAEPAAGLSALATLCHDLPHQRMRGILHLRQVNHHLVELPAGLTSQLGAARQSASSAVMAAAVSSFAYQGSNAHCVLTNPKLDRATAQTSVAHVWEKERCWVRSFRPHSFIQNACSISHRTVRLEGRLLSPAYANIQHVQLCGQLVVPMSFWLEISWAAADAHVTLASGQWTLADVASPSCMAVEGNSTVFGVVSLAGGSIEAGVTSFRSPSITSRVGQCRPTQPGKPGQRRNPSHLVQDELQGQAFAVCNVSTTCFANNRAETLLDPLAMESSLRLPVHAGHRELDGDAELQVPTALDVVQSTRCGCWLDSNASLRQARHGRVSVSSSSPSGDVVLIGGVSFSPTALQSAVSGQAQHVRSETVATKDQDGGIQQEDIEAMLMDEVAALLGFQISPAESLVAAGLDSIGAVELRNRLQSIAGRQLPAVVVFDNPSIEALSHHLASICSVAREDSAASVSARQPASDAWPNSEHSIHLVSVSNSQPWDLAYASQDIVSPVPLSRWDHNSAISASSGGFYCSAGGWLRQPLDEFDNELFGINSREAIAMDPQQRLLLEQTHMVLRSLPGRGLVGAYVGIGGSSDFSQLCAEHGVVATSYTATGIIPSVASGRLSFTFGLQGPSVSIDTACSSSLVAAHQAFSSLTSLSATAAVSAGVLVALVPSSTYLLHLGGIMSEEGRCKVLDSSTDGYVRGEDVAAVLMCLASENQHGTPCATLLATAVNNDGASSSLTAPYGPAQRALLQAALRHGKQDASHVQACHLSCNGSNLGDVIEVNAVSDVLVSGGQEVRELPFIMMSIKSTTGHQEAASGATVMTAVTAILNGQRLPPMLHLRNINPHVAQALEGQAGSGSFVTRTSEAPWLKNSSSHCSAINSFGMQGTNAHASIVGSRRSNWSSHDLATTVISRRCWPIHPSVALAGVVSSRTSRAPRTIHLSWNIRPCEANMHLGLQHTGMPTLPVGTVMAAVAAGAGTFDKGSVSAALLVQDVSFPQPATQGASGFETIIDGVSGKLSIVGREQQSNLHAECQLVSLAGSLEHSGLRAPGAIVAAEVLVGFSKIHRSDAAAAEVDMKFTSNQYGSLAAAPGEIEAGIQLNQALAITPGGNGGLLLCQAALVSMESVPFRQPAEDVPTYMGSSTASISSFSKRLHIEGPLMGLHRLERQRKPAEMPIDTPTRTDYGVETQSVAPAMVMDVIALEAQEDRVAYLETIVAEAVEGILGKEIGLEDNLYSAGMDSRAGARHLTSSGSRLPSYPGSAFVDFHFHCVGVFAGIELRNLLSESTGLELPSALMYENPSIGLLSTFVEKEVASHYLSLSAAQGQDEARGRPVPEDITAPDHKPSQVSFAVACPFPLSPPASHGKSAQGKHVIAVGREIRKVHSGTMGSTGARKEMDIRFSEL